MACSKSIIVLICDAWHLFKAYDPLKEEQLRKNHIDSRLRYSEEGHGLAPDLRRDMARLDE
jgi:hypothetical protein